MIALNTNNCLARSDGVRIAMLGVNDLIIVASGNGVLVLLCGRSHDVKVLLEALRAQALRCGGSDFVAKSAMRRGQFASMLALDYRVTP